MVYGRLKVPGCWGRAAAGKSTAIRPELRRRARLEAKWLEGFPRKTSVRTPVSDRTKTDTGRWGEYPKALGRTVVKELGKIAP